MYIFFVRCPYCTHPSFGMSTFESFNNIICEFCEDLSSTFDEHQCLEILSSSVKKMVVENNSTPLPVCVFSSFLQGIGPDAIKTRSPQVLDKLDSAAKFGGLQIDVKADYESSDAGTKNAIWDYVQSLHAISTSLSEGGQVEQVNMESMDSILTSVSEMSATSAQAIMQSVMCLVPPGLKALVDEKVVECQRQIESGEVSTEDMVAQMKGSLQHLT